jgi:phospholipid/cholesterol/gamma-HCH transport system substrate-binding protein
MKRLATAALLIVALVAALSSGVAAGGDDGTYEVRAIFDNGAFLVSGEEVRIAGANVGTISQVDVTDNDEPAHEDGSPDPGKAVVVMRIEDAAFQDFRQDASCLIRPQSLLGEKFVECQPTQPHAPGTEAPPPLTKVPDGDPGAGQRFLPLESNGKTVDLDLVNNIQRLPYAERFRLILNDLGGALAGRGKDLGEVIDRADPALRVTDEVLAKIASQNKRLGQLARDGDRVLTPLARDRQRITGFLAKANTTAEATAERKPQFEAQFEKLPGFLRELRSTMGRLRNFSDQAEPAFADLGQAAPSINTATRALGPFSRAGIPALTSLGDAASQTTDPLNGADPVIRQLRDLSKQAAPGSESLNKLLRSTRKTDGFKYIDSLIYNTTGAINEFDTKGHILRTVLPRNNCVVYQAVPLIGCETNFDDAGSGAASGRTADAAAASALLRQQDVSYLDQLRSLRAIDETSFSSPKNTAAAAKDGIAGLNGLLKYAYGSDPAPSADSGPAPSGATADADTATVTP